VKKLVVAVSIGLLGVAQADAAPRILRHEPGTGRLAAGQTVLVDDGTCPKGQVKEVRGGSNRSLTTGMKKVGSARTRRCVPHP
jgi:hypothetical protein